MTVGTANWSFTQDDFTSITESLKRFLGETKSLCALLVDRSGQLVTTVGESRSLDTTAFASLTAADYSANDQLAKLVGEHDFSSLFHQGEKESIYVADIARRLLLVIIFDSRTTVGLVRLRMKDEVEELTLLIDRVFSRGRDGAGSGGHHLLEGADDEIDKLFNW
jgi:predicted regulator of Ras-like GTPase activity (Roadblock/LC7/MglB family)